ncbi:uncharacterized protein ASPGLDRAFT_35110 [Aspergillus glaucus CBS 516.65]|uniref:Uncharacterized protein n=1 Tax=Aspergillus glaucus CBS 516.65 TaxID=1160497 RepID=A0A1L9VL29_ASPGL|nr:hypothetical protein ASPGLDRAFT_35110 [Aspergillus glaucus CBS 516.65]OJJ84623.1 hypothetical protein ASPGLDRAFT_35110 [Aspergillus glaucus CBS 516.65]
MPLGTREGASPWSHCDNVPPSRSGARTCKPLFVNCSAAGCTATSAHGVYDSMTLRIGFSKCCKHLDRNELEERIDYSSRQLDTKMVTVIFYDLGLGKDGQVEQLSAFSISGEHFSSIIKTTVRANMSPNLKSLSPMLYNALASEPKDAMRRFIQWIDMIRGDTDMRNVGIKPPEFRLDDSLALFKLIKGQDQQADIVSLRRAGA